MWTVEQLQDKKKTPLFLIHSLPPSLPLPLSISLLQMFPMALVCGNTFIVKPSEQDPGACMMLVKMAQEAGVPDGVLNVIHGQKSCKASLLLVMFDVQ